MKVRPIPSEMTAMGKDGRALAVAPYVVQGKVKISELAYRKVVKFKDASRNHLVSQVTNYRPADPDAARRADDLLDTVTYGIGLSLGNNEGV